MDCVYERKWEAGDLMNFCKMVNLNVVKSDALPSGTPVVSAIDLELFFSRSQLVFSNDEKNSWSDEQLSSDTHSAFVIGVERLKPLEIKIDRAKLLVECEAAGLSQEQSKLLAEKLGI